MEPRSYNTTKQILTCFTKTTWDSSLDPFPKISNSQSPNYYHQMDEVCTCRTGNKECHKICFDFFDLLLLNETTFKELKIIHTPTNTAYLSLLLVFFKELSLNCLAVLKVTWRKGNQINHSHPTYYGSSKINPQKSCLLFSGRNV